MWLQEGGRAGGEHAGLSTVPGRVSRLERVLTTVTEGRARAFHRELGLSAVGGRPDSDTGKVAEQVEEGKQPHVVLPKIQWGLEISTGSPRAAAVGGALGRRVQGGQWYGCRAAGTKAP